jgi:ubiquitin C-terminal hydrolase
MSHVKNKYENRGLSGLANLGNTCFINSCLQILSHTYELHDLFDNAENNIGNKINKVVDSVVLLEWNKLRELMWSKNCIVAPHAFIRAVRIVANKKNAVLFTDFRQNDAAEFMLFLIDCFHNGLKRDVDMTIRGVAHNDKDRLAKACYGMMKNMYTKEYSEIVKLFYGIMVSELRTCETGKVTGVNPEPYFMIDLPIPESASTASTAGTSSTTSNITIYDCFDEYIKPELLTGDNGRYNEKTKQKEDTEKRLLFWSMPDILIVDLKRFSHMGEKNKSLVYFDPDDTLDLRKYISGYNSAKYIYELYGVSNHMGEVCGGHYTAFIKNANDAWYHINDTKVSPVVRTQNIVTSSAYCLFYRIVSA